MAYTPTTWNSGLAPGIDADKLNNLEGQHADILAGTNAYTGTGAGLRDEDNMVSDDATAPATQQSIKKYVDDEVAGSVEKEIYVPFLFASGPAASYPVQLVVNAPKTMIGFDLNAGAEYAEANLVIPNDFGTLVGAVIKVTGQVTGDFDWTVNTDWGATGELTYADSDSATADAAALTDKQVAAVDFSAALTGIVAGDFLIVRFTLDALNTTTNIFVGGLSIYYT